MVCDTEFNSKLAMAMTTKCSSPSFPWRSQRLITCRGATPKLACLSTRHGHAPLHLSNSLPIFEQDLSWVRIHQIEIIKQYGGALPFFTAACNVHGCSCTNKQSLAIMAHHHHKLLAYMQDPLSLLLNQENKMPGGASQKVNGQSTARQTRRRTRYALQHIYRMISTDSWTAQKIKPPWRLPSSRIPNQTRLRELSSLTR